MNRTQFSLAAFAGAALLAASPVAMAQPAPPVLRPAPPVQRPAAPLARPAAPTMRPAAPVTQPQAPGRSKHHHGDHRGDRDKAAANETPEQRAQRQAREQAWHQADEKHRQEMKKTRASRRKARQAELKKKWGNKTLEDPKAHSEMQTHSWRQARLQRLRTLATEQNRPDLVARIDKLEKEEQTRHDNVMARYKGGQP